MDSGNWPFRTEEGILVNVTPITSISDYVRHVDLLTTTWDVDKVWLRGTLSAEHKPVPGIYRDEMWDFWRFDNNKASELFDGFILRAKSFFSQVKREYSDWEWYHLMQHYGLPTRLLDWTEGYLIALFFALRDLSSIRTPSVWVLDPFWLNGVAVGETSVLYGFSKAG